MAVGSMDHLIILDGETLEIVTHSQNPGLPGTNFLEMATSASAITGTIEANLRSDGDTTIILYNAFDTATGSYQAQTVLLQLHDGYIFAAGQPFVVYTR